MKIAVATIVFNKEKLSWVEISTLENTPMPEI
jgi:hypothetical protein